ncbi:type II restriction endonuclease subunit M [Iodidimonas sp. SYSU 1G8]|uniref:type II restriction endonuclease subunit M n=1 Tax=Iodidimonas sp. SYSU 1G8 TaxID=3133967 RepID=UPI0031FEC210
MTVFLRLLSEADKSRSLSEACNGFRNNLNSPQICEVEPYAFRSVPGAPFAYWVSEKLRRIFQDFSQFESNGRAVRQGLATADDFRFVRAWWEITADVDRWPGFAKGGSFSPFYHDIFLTVNWRNQGAEIRNFFHPDTGKLNSRPQNIEYFRRAGLTWPLRAKRFSPQALPRECVFSVRGYSAFPEPKEELSTLALFNSSPFDYLFKTALGRFGYPEFIVGILQIMPWPELRRDISTQLKEHGLRAWSLKRGLDTVSETSHAFHLPAALRARLGDYDPPSIEAELAVIQAEIDDIAFDLYGFSDEDRAAALGLSGTADEDASDTTEDADYSEDDDGAEAIDQTDGLLSWAAGVAFSRFDWRLATGERAAPPEPEPFDPLPAKSPGMLPDGAEPFHAHSGILVDDQGHPHDLARLIEEVLARVEAPVPADMRRWLQRDFFPLHLRQYSKSRRKAPIYWPISTSSGSYTLWLYYPSLTSQTLYSAVNDFVDRKLREVSRDATTLRDKGAARSRDDEKAFEGLQTLELELIELRDTLLQIAPAYRPNHDDGVQITAAPLWQLFRHKPWQKVLKDTWARLVKGDFDWAHLAMAYWPDRVREKCKTDKSLAIAHDLEHLYVEPENQPKKARKKKAGGEE